jgi:multidrug efflux system outer membrane protein
MRTPPIRCLLLLACCGACRVGPDHAPPEPEVAQRFDGAAQAQDAEPVDAWWTSFGDPVLEACLAEAFAANHDVRASLERIRAARALRQVEASRRLPQVGAGAGYAWDRISENNPRFGPAVEQGFFPRDIEYWEAGFDVAWELDLFGGIARRVEAAAAELEEQEYERGALLLSVASEVAREYLELRGMRARRALLERQIEVEERRAAVLEQHGAAGLRPAGDALRGRAQVQELRAQAPLLAAEEQAGAYRLAVLLGRRPQAGVPELAEPRALPAALGRVPVGLPSSLLLRRPDVRAAERRLAARSAEIGAARAERFPRFWLTGSPYLQAEDFDDLFSSSSSGWTFGPSVSWNLFDGGRSAARSEAAQALHEEAAIEFEATVNRVLEEVESSLVRYGREAESLALLDEAAALELRRAELEAARHALGIAATLELVEAQASALAVERRRLDGEVALLTRLVALHKALGGGWAAAEAAALAAASDDGAEAAP